MFDVIKDLISQMQVKSVTFFTLEVVGLYPKGVYKKAAEGHFTSVCSDRTRGNCFKVSEGSFGLDIRKKLFTVRVVRHW